MLAADGTLLGFWIASQRITGEAHTHRVAVEAGYRQGLISRQLFVGHWKAAVARPGIQSLTVEVGSDNRRAQVFYRAVGFTRANAAETSTYLKRRQRDEAMKGQEIVSSSGALSRVMTRAIELRH